jgi:hypothetical protein
VETKLSNDAGATPTLQQVLTAGATTTGGNTIINGANTLEITNNTLAGASGLKLSSTSTAAASDLQKVLEISTSGANANSGEDTYGLFSSNTHTGTTSTNFGIRTNASGAVTNYGIAAESVVGGGTTNIAGYFSAGSATNNYALVTNGGNVGFGTLTPTMKVQVQGRLGQYLASVTSANDLTLGDANTFTVTNNTQINAITTANWQNGSVVRLIFTGTPVVKNNTAGGAGTAPMLLAGGVDFNATANDVLTLVWNGTNWLEVSRSVN